MAMEVLLRKKHKLHVWRKSEGDQIVFKYVLNTKYP